MSRRTPHEARQRDGADRERDQGPRSRPAPLGRPHQAERERRDRDDQQQAPDQVREPRADLSLDVGYEPNRDARSPPSRSGCSRERSSARTAGRAARRSPGRSQRREPRSRSRSSRGTRASLEERPRSADPGSSEPTPRLRQLEAPGTRRASRDCCWKRRRRWRPRTRLARAETLACGQRGQRGGPPGSAARRSRSRTR